MFDKESLHAQVENTHGYHRPEYQETMDTMGMLRGMFKALGHTLVDSCPASRELSLALTNLDECNMWAIAALARHEPDLQSHAPNTTSHPLQDST